MINESIDKTIENLQGVKYDTITIQRLIKLSLNSYYLLSELQDRIRELENRIEHLQTKGLQVIGEAH